MCLHRHRLTNFYGDLVCADCLRPMPEKSLFSVEERKTYAESLVVPKKLFGIRSDNMATIPRFKRDADE